GSCVGCQEVVPELLVIRVQVYNPGAYIRFMSVSHPGGICIYTKYFNLPRPLPPYIPDRVGYHPLGEFSTLNLCVFPSVGALYSVYLLVLCVAVLIYTHSSGIYPHTPAINPCGSVIQRGCFEAPLNLLGEPFQGLHELGT